ncbi:sorting nexin-19-like [Diadema antillarum]|uniref:sorting nexin-19-like n=1 Tax=Diadema antillarum TaxID=105358 RepID=UPI003A8626EC
MVTKATKCEGMRSCFSADCLTQLDGGVFLTPSEENPSASVQSIPKNSIADSCSSISDSENVVPLKVQFLMEDTDMSTEERTGLQEVKSTPSGELSSDTAEDDGQATQTEVSSSALSTKPLTLLRSKTEPALLDKPPRPKAAQSPGGEIPREWASWKIADLCIPTTSWMGDPSGKKPIVFFIINYTLLKKPTVSDDLDVTYTSTTKQEVRRRYREFVNLHARISNNPLLRRHLKGLKNVPKQSVLPLARPGAAAEEQKRVSLESYLMQVLDRRILHNSREIAEFLAIDGDAHIEFVRRPNQTPRIDKLLIRQVTGFVGQLKTALPPAVKPKVNAPPPAPLHAAPPQSRSAKHQRTAQSRDRRNSIAEKQTGQPALDQQPLVEDEWDLGVVDSSSDRLLGVDEVKESHIQKAMRLLVAEKRLELAQSAPLSPNLESEKTFLGPRSAGDGSDAPDALPREEGVATKERGKLGAGNVALYQAVYGVLSEALLTQQSFILDKNMQKALQVGIGGLIDRWLENEIGLLFTEAQWGYYLSLLRELFWPGGMWRPKERESKSTEEMLQTKREALHELTHNAVSVGLSLLIGEEDLTKGVSLVLDSLQDAELNKHLVFTFLDHAMDQLVPEISEPKFQALLDAMP